MTLRRGGRWQTEGVTTGGYFDEIKARTDHMHPISCYVNLSLKFANL